MHDLRFIRDNPDAFDKALARRGLPPQAQRLIALDEQRRAKILALETAQARRNAASKEIGEAKKNKDDEKAKGLLSEVAALKESMPAMEAAEKESSKALNDALAEIPNLPLDEVPDGKDEKDNVEHHRFGARRDYAFAPKQHFDLGEALGQMDFETAAKLSGARFVVLKKGLARLERALGQLMLDVHTSEPHNYIEVSPPLLVRDEAMFGTAQLPKFKEDQFGASAPLSEQDRNLIADSIVRKHFNFQVIGIKEWDFEAARAVAVRALEFRSPQYLWLIPTAEVPLTNLVRASI